MNETNTLSSQFNILLKNRFLPYFSPVPHTSASFLTKEQIQTAHAAQCIVNDFGFVLICEDTGVGKSYIAAHIASRHQGPILIIAPAHLIGQWQKILLDQKIQAQTWSYQMASLGKIPNPGPNTLWILDEAHFLKNSSTMRFQNLKQLMIGGKICLLTATPISMGYRDLLALIQLGDPRRNLSLCDNNWIQSYGRALMPKSYVPPLKLNLKSSQNYKCVYYNPGFDHESLEQFRKILKMARPIMPDNDDHCSESSLIIYIIIQRLISHRKSCLSTVNKLVTYYKNARLSPNQMLTRKDFAKIMGIDGNQLLLPFKNYFYGKKLNFPDQYQVSQCLKLLQHIQSILTRLCTQPDEKLMAVQNILEHSNDNTIIFTQYADTAIYFAENLKIPNGVALITSKFASIQGCPINRDEILSLFSPNPNIHLFTQNTPTPKVLVCSDAMSCGHNLQNASSLIHLDMPWNPTTIKQREGRILRIGQNARRIQITQLKIDNQSGIFSEYENDLCLRIQNRSNLQKQWHDKYLIQPTKLLLIPSKGLPGLWGKHQSGWIPVCHLDFLHPSHPFNVTQISQTTLLQAFEEDFSLYKKFLTNSWNHLKCTKHNINSQLEIHQFLSAILSLIITPHRIQYLNGSSQQQSIHTLTQQIINVQENSLISENQTCYLIELCYSNHT